MANKGDEGLESLFFPEKTPKGLDRDGVIRMLLLCRSNAERRVVTLHVYHGLGLDVVAERAGMAAGRTRDVFQSIASRTAAAEERCRHEQTLERALSPEKKRTR